MFKRSRHFNLTISIISQDYYGAPKRTILSNGKIYHLIKPNKFRDVPDLYQHRASMYMTLNEVKYLTSGCWKEKDHPLTIEMTNMQVVIN